MNMPTSFDSSLLRRCAAQLLLFLLAMGAVAARAGATECPCPETTKVCLPRTQDEVWLVSSRCLGCPDDEPLPPRFEVFRYNMDLHEWDASTLDAFLAA